MTRRWGGDRLREILCVAMLALSQWAAAEVVPDLYSVSVPVAEQSAAELQRAAGIGLREVAVRISGRSAAASETALSPSFANATHYLEQYRYERSSAGDLPWIAQLRFSSAAVDAELRKSGLPVWGGNRPALLAIVAAEDKGVRTVIDEQSPLANVLREQWHRRGLLLHLPSNPGLLSVDDVVRLDSAKIAANISERSDGFVLGSMVLKTDGGCESRWALVLAEQVFNTQTVAASTQSCVAGALDRIVDNFSAQYAIAASSSAEGIVLRVTGVVSFDDYIALLTYLRRLAVIKSAQPVFTRGDEILLQLKVAGSTEQLERQLALESRLSPSENTSNAPLPMALSYRWVSVRN